MPITAMSSGGGAAGSATSHRPRSAAVRAARNSAAPSVTALCSPATVVTVDRSRATSPAMNMPSANCSASGTATSAAPSRRTPLLATRSRPTLSRSSVSHASRSPASSALIEAYCRVNGLRTQRVAWPGAVSSRSVCAAASTWRWNSGSTAPADTASSVNRYAVPISTPTATPRAASGAASTAAIAADRSSCTPPASRISISPATPDRPSRNSASTPNCASHNGKLLRGPTCPPHSAPSNTNRRAPAVRNWPSRPGEGTCRNVRMPARSSAAACVGRPPAMITCDGRSSSITASCAALVSSAANPRTPTPHGRSPSAARVSVSSSRVRSPSASASATNGSAPCSATAAANSARSLTRVIGPCATGSAVPMARLIGVPRPSSVAAVESRTAAAIASCTPRTAAAAVRQRAANRAARKPS